MTLLRLLGADAAPTLDDLLYVLNAPGGTPGDRKVALGSVAAPLAAATAFTDRYAAVYGVAPSGATSGATDVANVNAAIAAAQAAGGGWVILGRGGPWYFNARPVVPDTVNLWGQGFGEQSAATRIICTAAGAGVEVGAGRGGVSGNFCVDGDDLATEPILIGHCVNRVFIGLESTQSAGAGVTLESSQNNTFYGGGSSHAATIGVLFDQSPQNNTFHKFPIDSPGTWYVVFQQTGAPPVGLAGFPFDNHFHDSIFERVASAGGVWQKIGQINGFHRGQIVNSENDASFNGIQIDDGLLVVDATYMPSNYNVGTAFKLTTPNATLVIEGEPTIIGYDTVFDNAANGVIDINGFYRPITYNTLLVGTPPNEFNTFDASLLGTIPIAAGAAFGLTTVATTWPGAFFRLDPAHWAAAPSRYTLQYRFRVLGGAGMVAADVFGMQPVDDAGPGLTAELTGAASAVAPGTEIVSAWLTFPAAELSGYLNVRNLTAARGAAISACIEVRHG